MFSPIVAILFVKTSWTVFSGSEIDFSANKSSTVAGAFTAICLAISATNDLNSAFEETKSVSALTSTTAPTFPSSDIYASTNPSAATLSDFLAAFAIPLSRNNSIAFSISPSASVKTFLQSIIPAPVFSLNSFTWLAVTIVIPLSKCYFWNYSACF